MAAEPARAALPATVWSAPAPGSRSAAGGDWGAVAAGGMHQGRAAVAAAADWPRPDDAGELAAADRARGVQRPGSAVAAVRQARAQEAAVGCRHRCHRATVARPRALAAPAPVVARRRGRDCHLLAARPLAPLREMAAAAVEPRPKVLALEAVVPGAGARPCALAARVAAVADQAGHSGSPWAPRGASAPAARAYRHAAPRGSARRGLALAAAAGALEWPPAPLQKRRVAPARRRSAG